MRRESGHGISGGGWEGSRYGCDSRNGKNNHPRWQRKPTSAPRNWSKAGLGLPCEYTGPNNKPIRGERRHEIRHLLRAAIAAPVGSRRRTQALPERADATGNSRPAWLRPDLVGGNSFLGRIL